MPRNALRASAFLLGRLQQEHGYTGTVDRDWYLAMAKLDAMAANIPGRVDQKSVDEFHEILALLARATGEDSAVFRIPDDKMDKKVISFRRGGFNRPGSVQYTQEEYCDDNFFRRRLTEVKNYFANFQPPHNR
jgi:hypothetical protein